MTTNFKIIQPEGILDSINANNLRREVLDVINSDIKVILVNLENISFMNSSGLGALVATLKSVKAAGGELALCSLNEQLRIIFELSKMERIFKVFQDQQEFEVKYLT